MRRNLTIIVLIFTMIVSSLNPACADETAAQVYDTAAQLLTGTGNVTLTGSATFSLDGAAFKFVETTYVQDGVNSKWVLNLSSPRADGSLRENGFTAVANNRWKYGMEVVRPGLYTVAEDDPQSVILRPSAELTQIIALGHALLEQLPTFPEDVFSLSEGKHLSIRLENEHIPGSVSNLLSLATWLAVQRTINIVDDSIAAPPYPEEAGTMDDYITPTQAIVNSTEKYELKQLSINAEMDDAGRFTEVNGTARIVLHTFLEGERKLHISFAGKASDYGNSSVAAFDPVEYGVTPAEGTWLPSQEAAEDRPESPEGTWLPRDRNSEQAMDADSRSRVYWINPNGGTKYHLDQNCPSVHPRYLPLSTKVPAEDLTKDPYSQLTPCNVCVSPEDDPKSSRTGEGDADQLSNSGNEQWYINPNGGSKLHSDPYCRSVHEKYLPLQKIELTNEILHQYSLCPVCSSGSQQPSAEEAAVGPEEVVPEKELKSITAQWENIYGNYLLWNYKTNADFVEENGTQPDVPYVFNKSLLNCYPDEDAIPAEEIEKKAVPLIASYGSVLNEEKLSSYRIIVNAYKKPDMDGTLFSQSGSWIVGVWDRSKAQNIAYIYIDSHTGIPSYFRLTQEQISYIGEPGVEPVNDNG